MSIADTDSRPRRATARGMTRTLYTLTWVALALSLAHHVDHVVRGDTGWPLAGAVNAFSYSLVIYPGILTGLLLSWLGKVGPRFWAFLSLGGAVFVLAVHLGPVATDAITDIPRRYASPLAGALAVVLLLALVAVLAGTFAYEVRLARLVSARAGERTGWRDRIARHRVAAFSVLAYALSWSCWLPLTLSGTVIDFGTAAPLYVLGLLGPLVSALVVTATTEGRAGVRDLLVRVVRWRVGLRWYAVAAGVPVALFVVAAVIMRLAGSSWPNLADLGRVSGLPAVGLVVVVLYAVLVNGLGEEAGWRGYALVWLQRRYSPLTAIGVLSLIWAAWHLPLLPMLTSLAVVSSPAMLPLFWFGLACLTVVLAWMYNRSGGSILIAALGHGMYNVAAGTAAAQAGINTVFTVIVMAGAAVLVWLELQARRAGRADSPLAPVGAGGPAAGYSARIE